MNSPTIVKASGMRRDQERAGDQALTAPAFQGRPSPAYEVRRHMPSGGVGAQGPPPLPPSGGPQLQDTRAML
ncbi:hypothetical protein ACWEN3_16775 [Streptomyces sp. NPDC004561]